MKIVNKPWGKEVWLSLNDKYCYKRIYINEGHRTSFQYHLKKIETNYIISGQAEIWLENDEGKVEKKIMGPDDFFTVVPPKKHRVVALTDLVLQEVSTPEVDDVIRIEDDNSRKDGRIEAEHRRPALCILAAGGGTRLKHLSKHINKAMLPINNKAAISNLIDKIPSDYEIVLALGYKGELIKEYCKAAHPNRDFVFVEVDKLNGPFAGPGYSLNSCREYLQRPFLMATADCFIQSDLPLKVDGDWLGIYPTSIPELYSTISIDKKNKIRAFKNKNHDGYEYAFIGLCSILDYETFWKRMDETLDESGELVNVFYDIKKYDKLTGRYFDWYDIGTIDNYLKVKNKFDNKNEKYGIDKTNGEFLYKINNNIIKLFTNSDITKNRIQRADKLKNLTPKLLFKGENLYSYEWISGQTLYELDKMEIWSNFLDWCQQNLWHQNDYDIKPACYRFYKDKTHKRLHSFLNSRKEIFGGEHIINGVVCKKIDEYLEKVDWEYICDGTATELYHGDLQFDNVIYNGNNFFLIDWRQSFGGLTDCGDVYYDLSKLYGGILMSYKVMKDKENFSLYKSGKQIKYSYKRTQNLKTFKALFESWVANSGYNLDKIKKITALIYLNMAPLHEKEFGDLLFFQSKLMMENLYD